MKRKKIVFTIPNFNTAGSGKALLNLAQRLNGGEFQTEIVCNSDTGPFFQVVKDSGIPVHVFDYIPSSRPLSKLITSSFKVAKRWRTINPDIVHSFHYSDNYTEGLAVRLARKKWVFTKKNMNWGGSSGRGWQLRSFFANAIAVQNTDMIRQFYPNSKKVSLIPRGVVTENFAQQTPQPAIREQMETASDARIIICVANMVPVKGVELLIDAFAALEKRHPEWVVWLVGDIANDYGKELVAKVATLGLFEKIRFSGKQADVRAYLDHAEIFVLPTKDKGEGSPVAMLEAMANGKLVIGSAVPGIKDQLSNHTELLFIPGDAGDLKRCLEKYLAVTPSVNQTIGLELATLAHSKFNISKEVQCHITLYNILVP